MYLCACVHISVCFPTQLLVFVCVSGLAGRVFIKSNLLVNIENVFTHLPTLCSVDIVPSPQLVKRKEEKKNYIENSRLSEIYTRHECELCLESESDSMMLEVSGL